MGGRQSSCHAGPTLAKHILWAGEVQNVPIWPYNFPSHLSGHDYGVFLHQVLTELLEDVPLSGREGWLWGWGEGREHRSRARIQGLLLRHGLISDLD
ncbi:hypothetical protein J6590_022419 [Homalodisca vitripennis]|nr:hypothetical protein J6590_022419 [Homalodisca vitripennis]